MCSGAGVLGVVGPDTTTTGGLRRRGQVKNSIEPRRLRRTAARIASVRRVEIETVRSPTPAAGRRRKVWCI